jgi:hypothetical protein
MHIQGNWIPRVDTPIGRAWHKETYNADFFESMMKILPLMFLLTLVGCSNQLNTTQRDFDRMSDLCRRIDDMPVKDVMSVSVCLEMIGHSKNRRCGKRGVRVTATCESLVTVSYAREGQNEKD